MNDLLAGDDDDDEATIAADRPPADLLLPPVRDAPAGGSLPPVPRPPSPSVGDRLPRAPAASRPSLPETGTVTGSTVDAVTSRVAPAVDPPAETSAKPRVAHVGRYELLLEIAAGGMATVYIGRLRGAAGFERLVAIKRMHPHVGSVPELAASFMDEAKLASLIRHPNVVSVHDVHEADGEHLLVMDFVDGTSLAALMKGAATRRSKLPRPVALKIVIDALHGLHAAHEQRTMDGRELSIVHRDATPHNILVGQDGQVRLTDFGIAKANERSVTTATGLAKGKFRYMAPEQARGGELDRRVDVFAMGIVIWELLTGRRMFRQSSDAEVLLAVTAGDFKPPSEFDPTVPPELDAIVMRALAPNREERWPTAISLADSLEAWAGNNSGLTTTMEVAQVVSDLCGEDLAERQKAIADVIAGRRAPVMGNNDFREKSGTGSTAGTSAPLTVDHVKVVHAVTESDIQAVKTRRNLLITAGVLTAALAVVLIVFAVRTPTPPEAAEPVASPAAKAGRNVQIKVAAATDISEIQGAGVTNVQFRGLEASFELPRGDDTVKVNIKLTDGAELEEVVVPKENMSIRVRSAHTVTALDDLPALPSAEKKKTPPRRPTMGARPSTKTITKKKKTGSGLYKNPYE